MSGFVPLTVDTLSITPRLNGDTLHVAMSGAVEMRDPGDVLNPYCFPGFSLHDELGLLVRAGLTPMEAIVGATSMGARIAGFNTGLVAAARQADFVVLNANPLDSISNTRKIDRVYLRGTEVPRAEFAKRWRAGGVAEKPARHRATHPPSPRHR